MSDNDLLRQERCAEIYSTAEAAAFRHGVREIEVTISASEESLTRFSNNAIGQNVSERSTSASIRVAENGRTARTTTGKLTRAGITAAVDDAVALARASAPYPGLLPLYEGPAGRAIYRWSDEAAASTPDDRARAVAAAIAEIEGTGGVSAGAYSVATSVEVLLNSAGLCCRHEETLTTFSVTAMHGDGSGWAKASSVTHSDVSPADLARVAARKSRLSRNPRELQPGIFTVILEPAAVLDFAGQMFGDFSGTAVSEQRSCLTERIGEKLFGSNISIYDDAEFPLQNGAPFDGEGVPRGTLTLVRKGVTQQVAYSRISAAQAGVEPTGHGLPLPNEVGDMPVNIVIAGGVTSIEDMIRSTTRGLLVTRLWYIREVEPMQKVMTGLTRDGTFLIEKGELACGVRNFRFNQSVLEALARVDQLSPSVRSSGEESFDMVVPAMKVDGFRFTEVTRY